MITEGQTEKLQYLDTLQGVISSMIEGASRSQLLAAGDMFTRLGYGNRVVGAYLEGIDYDHLYRLNSKLALISIKMYREKLLNPDSKCEALHTEWENELKPIAKWIH